MGHFLILLIAIHIMASVMFERSTYGTTEHKFLMMAHSFLVFTLWVASVVVIMEIFTVIP